MVLCEAKRQMVQYSKDMMVRQTMVRERAVSYSQMVRSNEGCVFAAGRKLCCLSGNMIL